MIASVISRGFRKIQREIARRVGFDPLTGLGIQRETGLEKIGSDYGGWVVPTARLFEGAICYCAGVGEDITFDLELVERFGCEVHAFDPTPRAIEHVRKHADGVAGFHFTPVGLWGRDEVMRFFAPADPSHVSHSVLDLQKTGHGFDAECRRLTSLMSVRGHDRLDLLKLDIEGAEYETLSALLADGLDVAVVCVEYDEAHHPRDAGHRRRIRDSAAELVAAGYRLVHVDGHANYTFVRDC